MIGRRRARNASAAFVVILGAVVHASCRQFIGAEERATCEQPGDEPSECVACTGNACCAATLKCQEEPQCAALDACLVACAGAEECRSTCRFEHLTGPRDSPAALAFADLASCRASSCADPCGLTCGGYVYPDVKCAKCAAGNGDKPGCCSEAIACSANAECLALAACERVCGTSDQSCRAECQLRHPAGMDDARVFAHCLAARCGGKCGLGEAPQPDWDCLGGLEPLPEEDPTIKLVVDVAIGGTPLPPTTKAGVVICPCEKDDPFCRADADDCGMTLDDGTATVRVRDGFDGYLEGEAGDSGLMGFLAYVDAPVHLRQSMSLSVLSVEEYSNLYGTVGTPDVAMGHVFLRAVDCDDEGVSGISFALLADEDVPTHSAPLPYYGAAPSVPCCATDGGGYGGFINAAPGTYRVVVTRRDTLQCIAAPTVFVRAGKETQLVPDPGPVAGNNGGIRPAPWTCPK